MEFLTYSATPSTFLLNIGLQSFSLGGGSIRQWLAKGRVKKNENWWISVLPPPLSTSAKLIILTLRICYPPAATPPSVAYPPLSAPIHQKWIICLFFLPFHKPVFFNPFGWLAGNGRRGNLYQKAKISKPKQKLVVVFI